MSKIKLSFVAISLSLICSFLLFPESVIAQEKNYEDLEYVEMFTEGKEWTLCHFSRLPLYGDKYYTDAFINVKVSGEALIEGIKCKRLIIDIPGYPSGCAACDNWLNRESANEMLRDDLEFPVGIPEEVYVYEKDRKIYYYSNPGWIMDSGYHVEQCDPHFELFMDLNKSVGEYASGLGLITTDDIIEINGHQHRRIATDRFDDGFPDMEWIEGIGCSLGLSMHKLYYEYYGLIAIRPEERYYALAQVKDNGTIIYDQTEKVKSLGLDMSDIVTAVEDIVLNKEDDVNCYDITGRLLESPCKGAIYIKNGKKYINPR